MVLFHIERLSFSLPPLSDSIHFCVFTCMHVDPYVCVHMDVCVHACMQVCVHTHMWKPEKDAHTDGLLFLPHDSGVRDL